MSTTLVCPAAVTNPSAAAAVATTGTLGQGKYVVVVTTILGGTTAAADLNNMQLQVGTTVIGPLLTVVPTATGYQLNPPVTVDVPGAGAAITVNAIGNASGASVTYRAQILATVG